MKRGRLLVAVVIAALCLGGVELPADAASKGGTAKKPRCHTAKRKGKPVRVCTKKKTAKKKAKKKPAASGASLTPIDYTKVAGLSEPTYTDIERIKLNLPVSAGGRIHLEIVKPRNAKDLGVILESSPYEGTLYPRTGGRMIPLPGPNGQPLGLSGFFPKRGYAVVFMDLRGTGLSSGCLNTLGPADQSDLRDVIEWAGTQSWSNGRVGMIGHSYVGSTPIIATKLKPQHLVTIVPSAGLPAVYDHQWQLGVPFNAQYLGPIEAYQQLALQRDLPIKGQFPSEVGPLTVGGVGEHAGQEPFEIGCGLKDSSLASGEQLAGVNTPWHKARDASKQAADFPGSVFAIHGENDQAARISNLHWLFDRGPKSQDKVWIGQWDHGIGCCPNRRGAQWVGAIHAWFDHALLRRNVDTGPPVEIFMNDASTAADANEARKDIYTAPSWPPATARTITMYASRDNKLGTGPGLTGAPFFIGDPLGFLAEPTGHLRFTSAPFDADTILLGLPQMTLAASVTLAPLNLIATLYSAHNFDFRRITQCAMNPQLRGGADHITPVRSGQRMQLHPPCFMVSQVMHPGDRLVLEVTTSDPDKLPLFTLDPHVTVYTGGSDGTHVDLPVATGPLYPDAAPVEDKAIANP